MLTMLVANMLNMLGQLVRSMVDMMGALVSKWVVFMVRKWWGIWGPLRCAAPLRRILCGVNHAESPVRDTVQERPCRPAPSEEKALLSVWATFAKWHSKRVASGLAGVMSCPRHRRLQKVKAAHVKC